MGEFQNGGLVSIIVPVYNVEMYLKKCIDSLLNQEYRNIEVVLVDDGSTDDSPSICDNYRGIDSRVKVIHKKNGGLSDARNVGIEYATGDYYTFVDSDDSIDKDYVWYLYELLTRYNADMSICEFDYVDENGKRINSPIGDEREIVLTKKEAVHFLLKQKPYSNSASGKLFKKEFFANLRFPIGKLYEDTATIYKCFLLSEKIIFGARPLYQYLYRTTSLSKQGFSLAQMDAIYNAEIMVNEIVELMPELSDEAVCRLFDPYASTLAIIPKTEYPKEYSFISRRIKQIRHTVLFCKEATKKRRVLALVSYLGDKLFVWFMKMI